MSSIRTEATVVEVVEVVKVVKVVKVDRETDFVVKLSLHFSIRWYKSSHHMLEPLHDVMVVQFPTSSCMCERK